MALYVPLDENAYFRFTVDSSFIMSSPIFDSIFDKNKDELISSLTICSSRPPDGDIKDVHYYQAILLIGRHENDEHKYILIHHNFKTGATMRNVYQYKYTAEAAYRTHCSALTALLQNVSDSIKSLVFKKQSL